MATILMKRRHSCSAGDGELYKPAPSRVHFSSTSISRLQLFAPSSASFSSSPHRRSNGSRSSFSTQSRRSLRKPRSFTVYLVSPTVSALSAPLSGVKEVSIRGRYINGDSALEALLSNPLRFVPATQLTQADEMVVTLRPRKVKGDSVQQQRRRQNVRISLLRARGLRPFLAAFHCLYRRLLKTDTDLGDTN